MGDRLKGKVAVVTGGAGGIGRGICLLMAEEGAQVVVSDVGVKVDGTEPVKGPADQVAGEIRKSGGQAVAVYDSVATMEGGERIIQTSVDNFGRIDILVTTAGILRDRMVFNMTEEEWDAVVDVHLKGTFTCVKYASILMRQQRSGRIITFTSTAGLYGNAGQANYGAAKDGIAGLTRVVARDLGKYGVTCNAISPTASTRMTGTIPDAVRQRLEKSRGGAGSAGRSFLELDPDDIAPFVVYLSTDEAANINGQILAVRGGLISLLSHPAPIRTMQKKGRWTYQEIADVFPSTLGWELVNPAPPAPPPS